MAKAALITLSSTIRVQQKLHHDLSAFFKVIEANSGTEALKILRENHSIAAIVMDHSIEDHIPHAFIDKVRNNPVTRNLPFIMISREGSNSFVHQAVRSGVSHYIGMPYEPTALIEKIQMALEPAHHSRKIYFQWPCKINMQCTSFGRISYVSPSDILFETHIKLNIGDEVQISCPLAEGVGEASLTAKVTGITNDCFYNYPLAVTASWSDSVITKKIFSWIQMHKHLNSPKKAKVLCVAMPFDQQESLTKQIDGKIYSLRFVEDLSQASKELPFLKPSGLVINAGDWLKATKNFRESLVKQIEKDSIALILKGESEDSDTLGIQLISSPDSVEGVAIAIRGRFLPPTTEPDRIYFSKILEDSRLKIYLKGKALILGELGIKLALQHEMQAPCNLQLDLKTFSGQDLRNPYIRVWPPMIRPNPDESEKGAFKAIYESHFLGTNDLQATEIRQWLIDQEMKEKRSQISILPK